MAKVKVEVTTPGARAAADSLLKLSAAERKAALEAAGLSRALKKTGRAGKRASGSMLSGFARVGSTMTGIGSAAAAVANSVRLIRTEFERLKQIDLGAFTAQRTMSQAVGKFLVNNPQTSQSELSQMVSFSQEAGKRLGAGGGVKAFQALIAVRGQTPGASQTAQEKAIETAVGLKVLDPDVDMAAFAANAIKIQEASKSQGKELTMDQAFKMLLFTGARAGGDISQLAESTIRLGGAAGAATGVSLPDILSLFAFATAETGDPTGKRSATMVGTLLSGLQSAPVKVDGKDINLIGDSGLEKLLNLVERIQKGEFGEGEELAAVMRAATQKGGNEAMMLVGQLIEKSDRFFATRAAITDDRATGDITGDLIGRQQGVMPSAKIIQAADEVAGELTTSQEGLANLRAGTREAETQAIRNLRTTHKISTFTSPRVRGATGRGLRHGPGFRFDEMMDKFRDRHPAVIKERGEREVAQILADRLLGIGGPLDTTSRKMDDPSEKDLMAMKMLRAATTPEQIVAIMSQFDLIDPTRGGIDPAEEMALSKKGATKAELSALGTADLGGNLAEALAALIIALNESTAATRGDAVAIPLEAND